MQNNKVALEACIRRLEWKLRNGQQKQVRQLISRRQRLTKEQARLADSLSSLLEQEENND